MSNNDQVHPWSREADGMRQAGQAQPTWPAQSGPATRPGMPPQAAASTQRAPYQQPTPQPDMQQPTVQQPAFQASAQGQGYPPPSPFARPSRKGGRGPRIAGVIAVAVLAAGVGGGAGYAASTLAADGSTAGATQTQIVQADPSNPDWAKVAEAASRSVVAIQVQGMNGSGGQGSGVVIDSAGHIVTNNHVVSGAGSGARVTVLLGTVSYEATVVGTDPSTDLAVIKLVDPPSDLSVMGFGDNNKLVVGEPVMAIGNPLGLADTVTTGIVSALNRPVTTQAVASDPNPIAQQSPDTVVTAAIQTNAAINPGNSGGALVNTSGELVGITSSIASLPSAGQSQAGNIGIGFAIGSDQVRYVVDQLIEHGSAQHPQLGVSATDPSGLGQLGAVIAQVVPGSPAADGGLREGDLVTAVDGQPVTSSESLVALVRAGRVGEQMTLTVQRDGSEQEVSVTPVAAAA